MAQASSVGFEEGARYLERDIMYGNLTVITMIALFIIVCVSAAGHFSGPAMGWTLVGLSTGGVVCELMKKKVKERKWALLTLSLFLAVPIGLGAAVGVSALGAQIAAKGCLIAGGSALGLSLLADRFAPKPPKDTIFFEKTS